MNRIKLALFALHNYSAGAIDRAGADWIGGDHRRARAEARRRLCEEAMDVLVPPPRP
ncbi:MAG: hypothetical protein NXH79_09575 [Rhodobacteraceae bacterium]|jgi:hypothetical protein|nr:hypothetical protein [Paracoccaceae bacterium]